MCCNKPLFMMDVCNILREKYGDQYKIPSRIVPKFIVSFIGLFSAQVRQGLTIWGKDITIDNSPAREILGIDFMCDKQSLDDMTEALIATEYILPPGGYHKKKK